MPYPTKEYWEKRMLTCKEALEKNNFEVFLANDSDEARTIALETIFPPLGAQSVSWGGSGTLNTTGVVEAIRNEEVPALTNAEIIDTFDTAISNEEKIHRRHRALTADLFLTGTNAVTATGHLVNLDMWGNRACAIPYGPKWVTLFIGRNKLVETLEDAMRRIKDYAAPVNAMRLNMKTPCAKTGRCENCNSPQRICNVWTITEKAFPKGRIKVILINDELGL